MTEGQEAFEEHRGMERLLTRVIDMDCESLNMIGETEQKVFKKMTVVPKVLRNLSGLDGNEMVMVRHTSLLSVWGGSHHQQQGCWQ